MRFRKYHGTGNDFVMIEDLEERLGPPASLPADLVSALCDRHTGVGADGVIRIMPGDPGAVLRMDYYNADGGPAEMCGNGIRCLVELERRAGNLDDGEHRITTAERTVTVCPVGKARIAANMGSPKLTKEDVPMSGRGSSLRATVTVDGEAVEGTGVSMGNPHFVLFVPALTDELVLGLGSRLEHHENFPERTNVEFVVIEDATDIRMRVWERGIGETQSCGSGACAAAVAAAALDRTGPHVHVHVPGGELEVEWEAPGDVWLTGPAEEVFAGEIDTSWLASRGLERFAELVEKAS
jgi:diaminopimelate epimerase